MMASNPRSNRVGSMGSISSDRPSHASQNPPPDRTALLLQGSQRIVKWIGKPWARDSTKASQVGNKEGVIIHKKGRAQHGWQSQGHADGAGQFTSFRKAFGCWRRSRALSAPSERDRPRKWLLLSLLLFVANLPAAQDFAWGARGRSKAVLSIRKPASRSRSKACSWRRAAGPHNTNPNLNSYQL